MLKAIESFLQTHAPDLLEDHTHSVPPATLLAPEASPKKIDELKETMQLNLANMNSAIDKMVGTLKEIEETPYASEMNRIGMVFLQKAKDQILKHQSWMKNRS